MITSYQQVKNNYSLNLTNVEWLIEPYLEYLILLKY